MGPSVRTLAPMATTAFPLPPGIPPEMGRMIDVLRKLPGVGEKTAQKFAIHLVNNPDQAEEFAATAGALPTSIAPCPRCNNLARFGHDCLICLDNNRDPHLLCIVHRLDDLLAFEASQGWRGRYFLMGKLLSPLEGNGADDLPFAQLELRILSMIAEVCPDPDSEGRVKIVLGLDPSVEGEATAMLIERELLQRLPANGRWSITPLPQGVGYGAAICFASAVTLKRALVKALQVSTRTA